MANEAVIIEYPNSVVRRTVAEATTISKGTLCVLSDPNTAAASSATSSASAFAGIIMSDKLGGDGSTTASFAINGGVFDLTNAAFGTPAAGALVVLSGANLIRAAVEADTITGAIIGKLEETAATSEVVRVRLGAN